MYYCSLFFVFIVAFLSVSAHAANKRIQYNIMAVADKPDNTHTHNRFTAGLEYVRVHPGQQVPER